VQPGGLPAGLLLDENQTQAIFDQRVWALTIELPFVMKCLFLKYFASWYAGIASAGHRRLYERGMIMIEHVAQAAMPVFSGFWLDFLNLLVTIAKFFNW